MLFRVYITPLTIPQKGNLLVCHHGGGASGLSFAALAKAVSERSGGEMGVLSYDCRGHGMFPIDLAISDELTSEVEGRTRKSEGQDELPDLSLATLLSDFLQVVEHLFPNPKDAPSFVVRPLIDH